MRILILAAAFFAALTGVAHGASSGFFKTPSGNIVCYYAADGIDCNIKSGLKPPPAKTNCHGTGDYDDTRIAVSRTGRANAVTCSSDVGPKAGEKQAKVLGYGKTKTVGRLSCTSAVKGLTCRNRTHGFFVSRASWRLF